MTAELLTTPDGLAEVLRDVLESWRSGIHTAGPGIVQSYDVTKQTASIKPAIKTALPLRAGGHALEELPLLVSVPIVQPRAGNAWVHFPIAAGDTVLLVYCERDINEWRRLGTVVDAADLRMHGLSGAVAIPGLFPSTAALAGLDGTCIEFGIGSMRMKLKTSGLEIGTDEQTPKKSLALAEKVDALAAIVNAHVHSGVTTGSGSSGALVTPYSGGTSASTQAKVGA